MVESLMSRSVMLLSVVTMAMVLAGCGSAPQSAPAAPPTAEPPGPIATAVAEAEATVQVAIAKSGRDYCGRLCQSGFWNQR